MADIGGLLVFFSMVPNIFPNEESVSIDCVGKYLEVRGNYTLLNNCSYNLIISPIPTVTLAIMVL